MSWSKWNKTVVDDPALFFIVVLVFIGGVAIGLAYGQAH